MSRVDQKVQFDKVAAAYGIEGARRDRLFSKMSELSLTPDDVNVFFLATTGVLEKVLDDMAARTDALPAQIEAAARNAVGPIAQAATKRVEEAHAKLAADTGERVAEVARQHLDAELKTRRFVVTGSVAVVLALLALLAGWIGYGLGSSNVANLDAAVRSWVARPDIKTVAQILQGNPDLDASIGNYCAAGSGRVVIAEGVRNCALPLWLDGRAASVPVGHERATVVTAWNAGASFLNRYSPWTITLTALVLGIFLRKLIVSARFIPGAKWLAT